MELIDLLTLDFFADESHDATYSQVLTLAGVLAPRANWSALWSRWESTLKDHGVALFHATECEGSQGEFRRWPRDRRDSLQRELLEIIVDPAHDVMLYSTSLALGHYRELQPRLHGVLRFPAGLSVSGAIDDAYFILFQQLVQMVATEPYVMELPRHENIGFTFDRHRLGPRAKAVGEAIHRFREFGYRVRGTGFMNKAEIVPLQVADLVAYESYRFESESHVNGQPQRWQYSLLRPRWRKSVFMDRDYLERLVAGIETKAATLRQTQRGDAN